MPAMRSQLWHWAATFPSQQRPVAEVVVEAFCSISTPRVAFQGKGPPSGVRTGPIGQVAAVTRSVGVAMFCCGHIPDPSSGQVGGHGEDSTQVLRSPGIFHIEIPLLQGSRTSTGFWTSSHLQEESFSHVSPSRGS